MQIYAHVRVYICVHMCIIYFKFFLYFTYPPGHNVRPTKPESSFVLCLIC